MTPKVREVLAELKQRFEELYGDRLVKMLLYGSHARGDAEPGSDIDVLVVLEGALSPCEEIARTEEIVAEVSLAHDRAVACVFVSEHCYLVDGSHLASIAHREGVPV